jgi:hypothetical protein
VRTVVGTRSRTVTRHERDSCRESAASWSPWALVDAGEVGRGELVAELEVLALVDAGRGGDRAELVAGANSTGEARARQILVRQYRDTYRNTAVYRRRNQEELTLIGLKGAVQRLRCYAEK